MFFFSLFEIGGILFRDEDFVFSLSAPFLNYCSRKINSTSSPFSIVSLVFIRLYKLLILFEFVSDGICDICDKVGCRMKVLLSLCDWLHGHGFNIVCRTITRVFWGESWNNFGGMASCWELMQMFYMLILEDYW